MCKFWKQEKCNHHFPELNKKKGLARFSELALSPSRLATVMIAVAVVVGISYLMQTNGSATDGYKIKDLEKRSAELKQENEKLNLEYIELQSMANVVDKVSNLSLVAIGDAEVVSPMASAVALR